MPIANDELELQDIKHGVVSVLIENSITEPHLSRWYELSDYSLPPPDELKPPRNDAEFGERIMARLQESLARQEYEHYERINFMIFGVALAIHMYLILENMGIRRRRDLIGKINGMEKLLLQDDSLSAKTIRKRKNLIRKTKDEIRHAISNKTDTIRKERKKSSDPWQREPLSATIYEIVEILIDGLNLKSKKMKLKLFHVVLSLLGKFEIMKKGQGVQSVRSRYNRFQKRHSPYSSNIMNHYFTLVSKFRQQ